MTTTADGKALAHTVLFAQDEQELIGVVGTELVAAHATGATVVMIATVVHAERIEELFWRSGVDPDAARAKGSLVVLDAAEVLDRISPEGQFDPAAFEDVVGTLIRGLADRGTGRPIVAFGEIVDLLWLAGRFDEAVAVEDAWHRLMTQVPISLMCGYSGSLLDHAHSSEVVTVRDRHASVLAGDAVQRTWSFPADPSAASAARSAATNLLLARGLPADTVADLQIVVAELVANALVHARTPFSLTLRISGSKVVVRVGDESAQLPAVRDAAPDAPSGRGLRLLEALVDGWGVEPEGRGKVVWAELAR
jgi:anti-sigma regulatory factor (Ser/Thr protein kinase)